MMKNKRWINSLIQTCELLCVSSVVLQYYWQELLIINIVIVKIFDLFQLEITGNQNLLIFEFICQKLVSRYSGHVLASEKSRKVLDLKDFCLIVKEIKTSYRKTTLADTCKFHLLFTERDGLYKHNYFHAFHS